MCNAKGHPPGCMCGFGGEGHAGRRPAEHGHSLSSPVFSRPRTYESYVNPNAKCPVCDSAVFFYQSPDGGRVFFDELGPPWPKHPCTDNRPIPESLFASGVRTRHKLPTWQQQGWAPLFITKVVDRDRYVYEIRGELEYSPMKMTMFIKKKPRLHLTAVSDIPQNTIALLRTKNGRHDISLVSRSGTPVTVRAFFNLTEACARPKRAMRAS